MAFYPKKSKIETVSFKTTILSTGSVSYRLIGEGQRKIIFFHGFPGSSSQVSLFQSALKKQNLQVLCYDRPGYNQTTPAKENILETNLKITEELARQLGWENFEVVVVSGGTPYGLCFAQKFPAQVTNVRVVCGLGYIQHPQIKKFFRGLKLFYLSNIKLVPGKILAKILSSGSKNHSPTRSRFFEFFYPTSKADRLVISEQALEDSMAFTMSEAAAQNAAGPIADSKVYLSKWGEQLDRFTVPIHFWHGDQDLVISSEVSKIMSSLIPHSSFSLLSGEGHISLPVRRLDEILAFPL